MSVSFISSSCSRPFDKGTQGAAQRGPVVHPPGGTASWAPIPGAEFRGRPPGKPPLPWSEPAANRYAVTRIGCSPLWDQTMARLEPSTQFKSLIKLKLFSSAAAPPARCFEAALLWIRLSLTLRGDGRDGGAVGFSGLAEGQRLAQVDPVGKLVVLDPVRRPGADRLRVGRRTRARHHDRVNAFAQPHIRHARAQHRRDVGMGGEHALDFERRDLVAAARDDVLGPADKLDAAIGTDAGKIAGLEVAVSKGRLREFGRIQIAEHPEWRLDLEFAADTFGRVRDAV